MTTRTALYLRVSSEMQRDNYSLDAQRRALHDACSQRGYTVAIEETDEALSARSERIEARPGLSRILAAVDAGQIDVLMVHSLDRLARNVMTTLTVFKRLAAHNVAFVSLSEAIDYSTPEGRLQLVILGGFSAYFSDVLAKHVTKGKREAVMQGFANGRAPYGYLRDGRLLVVDPPAAEVVRSAFALAASGRSIRQLLPLFAGAGHRVCRGTISLLLRNRVYLGQVRHRRDWLPGQHEALIDAPLWHEVQDRLSSNKRSLAGAQRSHIYGGVLTCALCGSPMHQAGHDGNHVAYMCARRRDYGDCTAVAAGQSALSRQVLALLERLAVPDTVIEQALAANAPTLPVDIAAINRRLERLRETYELGDIARERYLARRQELLRERDASPPPPPVNLRDVATRLRTLPALWADGNDADRRGIVTTLWRDLLIAANVIVAVRPQPAFGPVCRLALTPHAERQGYYV
jgi:site-specific DNA recombinase